jgi:hypothetical protein
VLRDSVCVRLVLKWFHKDPFPHDFNFALEFPRLTTLWHFRHVAFEPSVGFFIELSQMFDEGVSVDSVRLQTFLNSWFYSDTDYIKYVKV